MTAVEPADVVLLERDDELADLRDLLRHASEGRGRLLVVEAAAGMGKTSLLRAAAREAVGQGFAHLRARGSELERDFAFGVVRQLLDPVLRRRSATDRTRLFAGAARLGAPLFDPMTPPTREADADASFATLHGLFWMVDNLTAERPVVMTVDDVQWADAASLRFLNFLAPRLDGLPLALLAAVRADERRAPDAARLTTAPDVRVLRPAPLSRDATAVLAERILGAHVPADLAAACRAATGGNPFLLGALLHEVRARRIDLGADAVQVRSIGPSAVAQAVLLRLAGRPRDATALVEAVAVLGDGAQLAEAAALAGLAAEDAEPMADLLVELDLLRMRGGLEFVHPIVREAVLGRMSVLARGNAHARAATLLRERRAPEERIAAQIRRAPPAGSPDRVALLRRVAAEALAQGAPTTAATWLERALLEPPSSEDRVDVLLELSAAKLRLGTPHDAVPPLTEALQLTDDPVPLTAGARLAAGALTWCGDADAAVAVLSRVIEAVAPRDRELGLLLEADRAAYAQQASLTSRAMVAAALEPFVHLAGTTPGERLVLGSVAFERARSSPTEREAVASIEQALAGGRLIEEQAQDVAGTVYLLVVCLLGTDALDLVETCLDRMLVVARQRASIPAEAFVIEHRGWAALRRGDVGRAEADARTALNLLTEHGIELGSRFALALLVEALVERGDLSEAEGELQRHGYGEDIPVGMASNALLEARALLHLAQGRTREGLDELLQFGRHNETWGAANPLASRWRSQAAIALASVGDGLAARELAATDLERARGWGTPTAVGIALRATALVEPADGIIDRLRSASSALETSPARLEHARVLVDLGAALRRANRRADARRVLEKGLRLARACGARPLVERAETELRAAGGWSGDRTAPGIDQLTASEQRVAELAAEGMSNPEIAQALFVTRKTVETHLGHVYQKLGVSGRGKLARLLAEQAAAES